MRPSFLIKDHPRDVTRKYYQTSEKEVISTEHKFFQKIYKINRVLDTAQG